MLTPEPSKNKSPHQWLVSDHIFPFFGGIFIYTLRHVSECRSGSSLKNLQRWTSPADGSCSENACSYWPSSNRIILLKLKLKYFFIFFSPIKAQLPFSRVWVWNSPKTFFHLKISEQKEMGHLPSGAVSIFSIFNSPEWFQFPTVISKNVV